MQLKWLTNELNAFHFSKFDFKRPYAERRKIKYREDFRPFAPVVTEEDVSHYFELNEKSPFMLRAVTVKENVNASWNC